jgi:hypothetical protein
VTLDEYSLVPAEGVRLRTTDFDARVGQPEY